MNAVTLKCKMITPMFLAGADKDKPELCAPSIKGAMRFWWRAAKGMDNIEKLQEKEAEIFGSQNGKSPFSIKIENSGLKFGPHRPLPHSLEPNKKFLFQGFDPDQTFKVTLICKDTDKIDDYGNILELSLLLGGLGRRSRRGFGSLKITEWDFKSVEEIRKKILDLLNSINNNFQINDSIESTNKNKGKYPVIEKIYFGNISQDHEELLKKIGQASHNYCNPALGKEKPRMASPVIARIQKVDDGYIPIITKLSSHFPTDYPWYTLSKQDDFIKEIL